jgi:hypothetical protein
MLFTNRNADGDLLVRSGHPGETRWTGKSNCAADAFMLLISLTLDNALNAKLREPQRLHFTGRMPSNRSKLSNIQDNRD